MTRKWFAFVRLTPEIMRDPVALNAMLGDAFLIAPEGSVNPTIVRYSVSPRDQDPFEAHTVVRVWGVDDGTPSQA